VVREYAEFWKQTGRTGLEQEDFMYTTIEKVLFLQRVPVFSRVAGEDLVSLARGSAAISFHANDVIFREGDPGGALYLVISGRVQLSVSSREVAKLGPNDVFGEMSIFDREPRATTATVTEEAELLRVSADDFHEAMRETVEIAEAVIQVLNRRLREADRRLAAREGTPPPPPPTDQPPAEEHDMD
jgi:CRP-like cAMP-binding protein